jgi:hypothetical protein
VQATQSYKTFLEDRRQTGTIDSHSLGFWSAH